MSSSSPPSPPSHPRILVLGADGLVGREVVQLILERGFPHAAILTRSGKELRDGQELAAFLSDHAPIQLAFLALPGAVARPIANELVSQGAVVLDFSEAFRLEASTPLLLAGVNTEGLTPTPAVYSLPNCTNPALAVVLAALAAAGNGLQRVRVHTVQAASGGGRRLLSSLHEGGPLQADVLPQIGALDVDGRSDEEAAVVDELRRILETPNLDIAASCLRIPVAVGHGMSLEVVTQETLSLEQAREALKRIPEVVFPEQVPTPRTIKDRDAIHLGRLRAVDASRPERGLLLWVVADNLRQGAATHAVRVAEELWTQRKEAATNRKD